METLLLAGGMAAGADWRLLLLAAGAVWAPLPAAVAVAVAVMVGRRHRAAGSAGADVLFTETIVGELRSGASLRAALRTACSARPDAARLVRRLEVGEPLPFAVTGLDRLVPTVGRLVEAAVTSGGDGGRMLPVFEELLVHATAEEQAAAELQTALAPVRASMVVLVGAPAAYLVWSAATGRLTRLVALPGGLWLAAVGGVLFVAGIGAMFALTRSVR